MLSASEKPHPTIRAAIASDQAVYLRGLAWLLSSMPEISLIGEAQTSAEAVQLCQMTVPDLLVLDFRCPPEQRRELAQQIHASWQGIKVILMVSWQEEFSGAGEGDSTPLYYFSRDVSEDELKLAVRQVLQDTWTASDSPAAFSHTTFLHQAVEETDTEINHAARLLSERQRNESAVTRELVMAGKIQNDILPEMAPTLPGWEFATSLEPARETSGDFYDFIPLTERKWGILVGDVTDKGMGAALFMALTSSLLRTYATRFPTLPALTLRAVSQRLLTDTRGDMFVTTVFGILEPHTGRVIFANAGHPPGYIVGTQKGKVDIQELRTTGMALGVSEQATWKQKVLKMNPGDYLILYTDGITEAQNPQGEFFGNEHLLDVILEYLDSPAQVMKKGILDRVHRFVDSTPRQDDIALIVVRREK